MGPTIFPVRCPCVQMIRGWREVHKSTSCGQKQLLLWILLEHQRGVWVSLERRQPLTEVRDCPWLWDKRSSVTHKEEFCVANRTMHRKWSLNEKSSQVVLCREARNLSYYSDLKMMQSSKPMVVQICLKAALPQAKILATILPVLLCTYNATHHSAFGRAHQAVNWTNAKCFWKHCTCQNARGPCWP